MLCCLGHSLGAFFFLDGVSISLCLNDEISLEECLDILKKNPPCFISWIFAGLSPDVFYATCF